MFGKMFQVTKSEVKVEEGKVIQKKMCGLCTWVLLVRVMKWCIKAVGCEF